MSQKDLLLQDLCARLPYGVKVHVNYIDTDTEVEKVGVLSLVLSIVDNDKIIAFTCDDTNYYNYAAIHEVKPYLVPLSSMTEEQREEFDQLLELELKAINDEIDHVQATAFELDFYHRHHFDYRGLIEKGLAIDATGLNIYD